MEVTERSRTRLMSSSTALTSAGFSPCCAQPPRPRAERNRLVMNEWILIALLPVGLAVSVLAASMAAFRPDSIRFCHRLLYGQGRPGARLQKVDQLESAKGIEPVVNVLPAVAFVVYLTLQVCGQSRKVLGFAGLAQERR